MDPTRTTTTTIKIVKSVYGKYVQVDCDGRYTAKSGGYYYGYDAATDRDAKRETLREIRADIEDYHQGHKNPVPDRWPRGAQSIEIEVLYS